MLRNYPIYFNDAVIPFPISYNASYDVVENVNTSEAGTDLVDMVRNDKLSLSMSFKMTSENVRMIRVFSRMRTFTLKIYDTLEDDYIERTVRMRNYKENLIPKSERISISNGLWEISFDLLEI